MTVPPSRISNIINGARPITADIALRMDLLFNMEPRYWLNPQTEHDMRYVMRDNLINCFLTVCCSVALAKAERRVMVIRRRCAVVHAGQVCSKFGLLKRTLANIFMGNGDFAPRCKGHGGCSRSVVGLVEVSVINYNCGNR